MKSHSQLTPVREHLKFIYSGLQREIFNDIKKLLVTYAITNEILIKCNHRY